MLMSNNSEKYTYRVMWSEPDNEFVGLCAEFPSLSWLDKSQGKALNGINKLVAEVLEDLAASGESIPEPLALRQFNGNISVRLPPKQHHDLVIEAAEQDVSLNRLIAMKLSH
jgi:predicted HicB family RNase H-like nuclease